MVLGAVLAVMAYTLASVLRARHRYLEWQRLWTPEKGALRALSLLSHQELDPCDFNPYKHGSTTISGDLEKGSSLSKDTGSSLELVSSPRLYLVRP